LINQVLDIGRIEAGREEVELRACEPGRLADDVMRMLALRAVAKNVELHLDISPAVPPVVKTDAVKLRQVLVNLLGNAIRHTERGSVTLRVSSEPGSDDDDVRLSFEVEDTGMGIAPEDHLRIFEPFVQLGSPHQRAGSGLGLAISLQFVKLLGGTIQVRSAAGEGALFRVELPAQLAGVPENDNHQRDLGHVLESGPGQPSPRILVVDDEEENRRLMKTLLENAGFQVRLAENGACAVEMFQAWHPDFICMDLRMPVVDGVTAAQQIRSLEGGQNVKIAAATASAYASDRELVLAAGMDDFIRKPFRSRELFECLARHLNVRYRQDAAPNIGDAPALKIGPESFQSLHADLRDELHAALIALDSNRIIAAIARINLADPELASLLMRLAQRYAYTALFTALEASRPIAAERSA
jgi:CheY-like chemotaxis protein/anti-sigma regulatory factor (Ser/Thr protein kinase)